MNQAPLPRLLLLLAAALCRVGSAAPAQIQRLAGPAAGTDHAARAGIPPRVVAVEPGCSCANRSW